MLIRLNAVLLIVFANLQFSSFAQTPATMRFDVRKPESAQGYYLLTAQKFRNTPIYREATNIMTDGSGALIYSGTSLNAFDFKYHKNGLYSWYENGKYFIMDSSFRIIDSVQCVKGRETDHHDFKILNNGHYLLIGIRKDTVDLSSKKIFNRNKIQGSKQAVVRWDVIQELDADKKLVFEWDAERYFPIDSAMELYLTDSATVSIPHVNSVATDSSGNIIASCRYYNQIIKIDRSDGTLIWRMGGPGNEFQFTGCSNAAKPFLGQHDVQVISDGRLIMYDNGYDYDSLKRGSSIVRFRIDERNKVAHEEFRFTYDSALTTGGAGSVCLMSEGRALIGFGRVQHFTPNKTFALIDSSGQVILELWFTDTANTYRAYAYDTLPVPGARPRITATTTKGKYTLSESGGCVGCIWSNGVIAGIISVDKPGVYQVACPTEDGGLIWSLPISVTAEMLSALH